MLIAFSIENFRSIKNKITLSFEASNSNNLEDYFVINASKDLRLLKLGLIYGANASGKTTILKALDFLRDLILEPAGKKTEKLDFSPFLFDNETINKNTFFSIDFFQNNIRYLYDLEFNQDRIVSETLFFHKPNKAIVYKRTTDSIKQLSKIEFGNKIKISKQHKTSLEGNTLWNNTVLGAYLKTNFDSVELQESVDWFINKLKPMISPKTNLLTYISEKLESNKINKSDIIEFLKSADFNISDIAIKKKEKRSEEVFFQHSLGSGNYTLSYNDESEGTQRYYQFSGLLSLMTKNESIFPIDEIESSLHPDLLKHFILTFLANSTNAQLIATTHYRELLIERDIFRDDSIWFTEKHKDGRTDLFSLNDFDSSVIRNTSSVFNAYKTGKLGAVPYLSDYYIELGNGKK